ncbi:uncharacterized protein LOC127421917 isoform X1 [Myxocyprinus asiaticus]|uniref:uncharacterized protein LOC127421917 isoform X1 n=1 Tax=Myxocyprinus asiaticus TaxID=70543 RepID=UPI002223B3BF|nr:uncharacterized protein LOC127421917 isoform X1 [Myxocyprinus asiaticus]
MLVTMLTAIYMMVRVAEQLGIRWVRQPEPLPYMVSQPLPWQVHNVSQGRRRSRTEESEGHRRNSIGVYRKNTSSSNGYSTSTESSSPDKAASTIQNQYRKYQQKKQKDHK